MEQTRTYLLLYRHTTLNLVRVVLRCIYSFGTSRRGLFVFENSTLEHLMDVLAQWYDIKKVNYTDDKLRKIHFTGNLKRYGSAERIMKAIMMACDVNIVLQNDTLSVSN